MKRIIVTIAVLSLALASTASAADIFKVDFERPDDVQVVAKKRGTITDNGKDGGKCLEMSSKGKYCTVVLNVAKEKVENMYLAFDYRLDVKSGKAMYVGINFSTDDGKQSFNSTKPQSEWTHFEVPMTKVKNSKNAKNPEPFKVGDVFKAINIYGRADNAVADETEMTLYVDNVRLYTK